MGQNNKKSADVIIAVFPFQSLSKENELDYLVTGFVDDLIIDLSRFKSLQVISPLSMKKLSGEDEFVSGLTDKLNADYFIKGSLRLFNYNLRITTQLINASDNSVVWADRYDENISSIFEIHDDIIQRIVSLLEEQIETDILSLSKLKKTNSLQAYELWLMGMEQLKLGTFKNDNAARDFFNKALKIDPNFARAYTGLSLSYFNEWSCQCWDRWDESQQGAFKYARKAVALDENDSVSLTVLGRIYLYKGEYEKGEHYLRKSLRLNPNYASNLSQLAVSFVYLGYTNEAEKLYQKAMRLNPLNIESYYATGSLIYFELGDFDKAIELGLKANFEHIWVDMPAMLAAAYFHSNNIERMNFYWNVYQENFSQRIKQGKPLKENEALNWMINVNPYKSKSNLIPFYEYLLNDKPKATPVEDKGTQNSGQNIFHKGSGLWEFCFEGKSVFLPDVKGFRDLQKLIEQSGNEIHCSELMGAPVQFLNEEFVLDDKAKQKYKKRIQELSLDIDEAELMNDEQKAANLRKEYEELIEHLSKSLGLGGRSRKLDSSVEKARSAVTWRIRSAIKKIEEAHTPLANHLSNSIKTGIFCIYKPEKSINWNL